MLNLDKKSIKYFIYSISLENKIYYLPLEIRQLIWEMYFTVNQINCNICKCVILNIKINLNNDINTETIQLSNGSINCYNCTYENN